MIEVGKVGVLGPGTYQPCSTILPLVKGPALVKPSLKVKLTQPGVVSVGSIATYVKDTGSPIVVPSTPVLLGSVIAPSPTIVTVLVTPPDWSDLSSWTDWIQVEWKSLPSPRSMDDTSSFSVSWHFW